MSAEKPDVPPPRYTEYGGGWRELIRDEQEWLARPGVWGIDRLPEEVRGRKQRLCDYYRHSWVAGHIECALCRPFVLALFSDGDPWFDEDALAGWEPLPHPAGPCGAAQLHRHVRNLRRGLITRTELFNHLLEVLFANFDQRYRGAERIELQREQDRRNLALELAGPNPFRPVAFAPAWRTDTAVALARGMYESRDFGAMPILADALQDAGCDSDAVLTHCRDPHAAHVRGCWVVDLVLGKP